MPPVTGRLVPTLTVRDLARSTAWYVDVFGVEIRRQFVDADGRTGDACLRHPSTGYELCLVDHKANPGDEFSEFRTGLDHLEFLVHRLSDLEAWARHLDALGIPHSGVKRPTYTRNAMITFRDLDNIQLELFWRAPERRSVFDRAAGTYQDARPEYPDALFEELIEVAALARGDRLLEVGCATGKATLPLAQRGFRITCVELGSNLAAAAGQNLAGFDVEVVEGRFEDYEPTARFDLVFAATAWHWLDPAVRYTKAWDALRRGGYLALWSAHHVFPDGGDPFFLEIQDVYDEIGEGLPPDAVRSRPGELPDNSDEIEGSGLFEVVRVRHFDWELVYDVEAYIRLLDTFSGHIEMTDRQRDTLYGEIRRRLARRADGLLRRHWGAVLHVARRLDG